MVRHDRVVVLAAVTSCLSADNHAAGDCISHQAGFESIVLHALEDGRWSLSAGVKITAYYCAVPCPLHLYSVVCIPGVCTLD